ncbi:hypothetical protein NP233_g2998 [Leucocoprinus birnbaumii]|uniref:Zinc finger PHD-type domain-containing protein n=1 Tax=Leucocoprinus birnbaumii TaxID=56174 RepID=A0AAD5YUC4_9AGAR|nr:hypothetical protein NP233_g2998 [Leucocoprinus birnbaumii]
MFAPMLNIPDVTVNDVEADLVSGTKRAIPRVMQRLLYTLTYDRKISLDNWQSALRKQYLKRDPLSNPLGPEPPKPRKTEVIQRRQVPFSILPLQDLTVTQAPPEAPDSQPPLEHAEPSRTASEISRAATQEADVDERKVDESQPTVDWFDLSLLQKLESMHLLTEWQFQNPTRLRMLMRSDDELATWACYDSKKNAYWLIGDDRLWIQRLPPKPARTLKRKRVPEKRKTTRVEKPKPKPSKRRRTTATPAQESKEGTPQRTGRGRAAKMQAKIKLDAQAKELAALKQEAQATRGTRSSARSTRGSAKALPARAQGTRISARLRGTQNNEWQSVPDEWLNESSDADHESGTEEERGGPRTRKRAAEEKEDSVSDLTELSDDSEEPEEKTEDQDEQDEEDEGEEDSVKKEDEADVPAEDFIEWETICVTLEEWEHIADRFEKATHYLEKALYKYLTNELVPNITEVLREVEKKKRLDEALSHRKRSSRLAIKESEKEEARLAKARKAEEEEKMGRARRLEARRQREEEERLKREQAREQRRKEREAREARRHAEPEQEEESSKEEEPAPPPQPPASSATAPQPQKTTKARAPRQHTKPAANGTAPRPRVKNGDWELDCEVCRKRGFNLDDRTPMMSCGKCFKWQHIACHDLADERAGRAKRNWDSVEFICQQCRSRMFSSNDGANMTYRDPRYNHHTTQGISLSSPYHHHTPYQSYGAQAYGAPQMTQTPTISSLYHAANGSYSHYAQPYGDPRATDMPDRYQVPSQSYPTHHYTQPPSTISFSHYQPRDGGFTSNTKHQPNYQGRPVEGYDQHPRSQQHTPYSDLRSSAPQRPTAGQPTQSVWSLGAQNPAGTYTTPYPSTAMPTTNGTPRRDLQLPPLKPGPSQSLSSPSSSTNDFNQPSSYSNTQFRYHSTT